MKGKIIIANVEIENQIFQSYYKYFLNIKMHSLQAGPLRSIRVQLLLHKSYSESRLVILHRVHSRLFIISLKHLRARHTVKNINYELL